MSRLPSDFEGEVLAMATTSKLSRSRLCQGQGISVRIAMSTTDSARAQFPTTFLLSMTEGVN